MPPATIMDELEALLAELEATKKTLSQHTSPVSFRENVADTFANSLRSAMQQSVASTPGSGTVGKSRLDGISQHHPLPNKPVSHATDLFTKKLSTPSLSDRRQIYPLNAGGSLVGPSCPESVTERHNSIIHPKLGDQPTFSAFASKTNSNPVVPGGASSQSERTCAHCHQGITGSYVRALDKDWHLDHLSCSVCALALTPNTIYEHNGALFCQKHHSELNMTHCAFCGGIITDRCVVALQKHWHVDHFFCSQCGKPLTSVGFMEHQGKAYCDEDYFALFAPPCGACAKPVMADCFAALDRSWHPGCFVCTTCLSPFKNGVFFSYEGKPFCETHYHSLRGSLCPGCNKPIVGKCVNAIGKRWHPDHFACSFCSTGLNKMPFREKEGSVFCVPCHTRLYG